MEKFRPVRVVILEGLDASGKESLTNEIVNLLECSIDEECKVIKEEFPRYETSVGGMIKGILRGWNKDMRASIPLPELFKADRDDFVMKLLRLDLKADVYVFDRYSRSNVYCNGCKPEVVKMATAELNALMKVIGHLQPGRPVELIEICINYDHSDVLKKNESIKLHASYLGSREILDENETMSKQLIFADDLYRSYTLYREPELKLNIGFDIADTAKDFVTTHLQYTIK